VTLAALLSEEVSDPQPRRDRPVGLCGEGFAQRLSLLGILRPPLPQLGMRREIGVDGLGTLGWQATIDARV
jgi:hypothetical protein